jgi:hypothetical protein
MADQIKTTVITEFIAATEQYVAAMKEIQKTTDQATDASEELQDQSTETSKTMNTSLSGVVSGLGKLIPGFNSVAQGFKKAEQAAKAFGVGTKSALIATGVGALVVAVGGLIAKFSELKNKSAEDMSFLESKLFAVGTAISDGIGAAIDYVSGAFKAFIGFLSPALAAEMAAYETRQTAIKETIALRDKAIAADERALAIARAAGESAERLYQMEIQLLESRAAAAAGNADELEKIETQRMVLDAARTKRLADEAEKTRELRAEYVRVRDDVNTFDIAMDEQSLARTSERLEKEIQFERDAADERAAIIISTAQLEQEQADALSAADQAAVDGAAARIDAERQFNKVIYSSMVGQKANQIKQAIINAKEAITAIWRNPLALFGQKVAQSAIVAAITAKQIKDIADVQFTAPAFADGGVVPGKTGGMIRGNSHSRGGVKFRIGGYAAEAEGGEFIVNRRSTARFLPLLQSINKKFADGGLTVPDVGLEQVRINSDLRDAAASSRPVLVIEDYRRASNRLEVVENLART